MLKNISISILFFVFIMTGNVNGKIQDSISLKGCWGFQKDPADEGIEKKWYLINFKDSIFLPGSMIEQNKGNKITLQTKWTGSIYDSSWFFNPRMEKYRQPNNLKYPFWLTPKCHYVGPAWYQKKIQIPQEWKSRRILLYLERPHWETKVWIDSIEVGMQNSLSTPHIYDLTSLINTGEYTITIRVDNRIKEINVGPDSHSLTDHTQGNWNGITGKIEIGTEPIVYIDNTKLFPNIQNKSIKAVIYIGNNLNESLTGKINIYAESFNSSEKIQFPSKSTQIEIKTDTTKIELYYFLGDNAQLWDEFNPVLYTLKLSLESKAGKSEKEVLFGIREFKTNGTRFEINGSPVFLRGNVDCAAFPLTGYPPTDITSWEKIFKTYQSYGLNHARFHSWCPPEAAFIAADMTGIYLQVEAASWANHGTSIGDGKPIDKYIYDETKRIINAYGNHPSFCMMAYSNEPAGKNQVEFLGKYVEYWKLKDNRRVYTSASIGRSWPLVPQNEFIVRSETRGLPWNNTPQSIFDYYEKIEQYTVPYVAHEMGQYCVFPNFNEIKKYAGAFKAKNFEIFRDELNEHGMGKLAHDFLMASGKLQVLCYKSEIEASLRTPGNAGFQLLSLNDFPGQGTALVGVVDVFWDDKGYISANEFNRFCNAVVPLARIPKFVYYNNETFRASVEVANFGPDTINNITPKWIIKYSNGNIFSKGTLPELTIPYGNCISLGEIEQELTKINEAVKLNFEVQIGKFINDWDFWVYPAGSVSVDTSNIYICRTPDEKAKLVLQNGGMVLVLGAGKVENGKNIIQHFKPVFWNTSWFQMRPPHTIGILCDTSHPVFQNFPTEFHSNLQWWELLQNQQVMNIDSFPKEFKPIIQPIDTWFLSRKLAILFEAKVNKGKIIVCSTNLESDLDKRPVAKQLYTSLINYMNSNKFDPKYSVDYELIRELFIEKERPDWNSYTNDNPDELKPKQ